MKGSECIVIDVCITLYNTTRSGHAGAGIFTERPRNAKRCRGFLQNICERSSLSPLSRKTAWSSVSENILLSTYLGYRPRGIPSLFGHTRVDTILRSYREITPPLAFLRTLHNEWLRPKKKNWERKTQCVRAHIHALRTPVARVYPEHGCSRTRTHAHTATHTRLY